MSDLLAEIDRLLSTELSQKGPWWVHDTSDLLSHCRAAVEENREMLPWFEKRCQWYQQELTRVHAACLAAVEERDRLREALRDCFVLLPPERVRLVRPASMECIGALGREEPSHE